MGDTGRIDQFQRDHAWSGFPLAVFYKFFDDQGNYSNEADTLFRRVAAEMAPNDAPPMPPAK